jgi:hypothetical protein
LRLAALDSQRLCASLRRSQPSPRHPCERFIRPEPRWSPPSGLIHISGRIYFASGGARVKESPALSGAKVSMWGCPQGTGHPSLTYFLKIIGGAQDRLGVSGAWDANPKVRRGNAPPGRTFPIAGTQTEPRFGVASKRGSGLGTQEGSPLPIQAGLGAQASKPARAITIPV